MFFFYQVTQVKSNPFLEPLEPNSPEKRG